jgi:CDP-alcohol phosphatidyltransferase
MGISYTAKFAVGRFFRSIIRSLPRLSPLHVMTFTGLIGAICMFPLRVIISLCVRLRIHPDVLTFVGVLINVVAAWALAVQRFVLAGVVMIIANIFDFIDGKVARERNIETTSRSSSASSISTPPCTAPTT